MTDMIDPYAAKIAPTLSKFTGGTLAGKNDPIARLFGIDADAIDKRLAAKEAASKPLKADKAKKKKTRSVEAMEAKHRGTRVTYSRGHGKGNLLGSDTVEGAGVKLA